MIIDATKKISSGYYSGRYGGVNFTVSKAEEIDANTKNKWRWILTESGECGQDWYSMKRGAILAVIDRITNIILNTNEMKPTREEARAAVLNLLSHITSPTDEQIALMKYVRGIIDEPYTEANRQIIEDCLGRTWMLIKEKEATL